LNHFQQLPTVDWTTTKFKIYTYVVRDGGRSRERVNELWLCVHISQEIVSIPPILQGLNSSSRCTRANSDEFLGALPYCKDALSIQGSGDRPLNQSDIVRSRFDAAGRFQKMHNVKRIGEAQEFVFT
jgi:hypothetical protein